MSSSDGGSVSCVVSTDCPIQSEDLVCTNDGVATKACVSCEAHACVRYLPVACQ